MTLQFRIPGPLGSSPTSRGSRPPGPLGYGLGIFAVPKQITKATKKLGMPLPAKGSETKLARDVPWNLFGKEPALGDVAQGALANCPLASLLAALAYTPSGRKHIQGLVAEHSAIVETDLSGVASKLDSAPSGNKIISNRYFTVTLGGKAIEVSSVLYTDDADLNWTPIYMRSPNNLLWACVIEKAYAEKEGGYEALDSKTANDIWKVVVGSSPSGFEVTEKTDDSKIRAAANNASKIPTIAASKVGATDVEEWHGFAVLGMRGSKIELHDPMMLKRETLSMEVFRKNFLAILFGSL